MPTVEKCFEEDHDFHLGKTTYIVDFVARSYFHFHFLWYSYYWDSIWSFFWSFPLSLSLSNSEWLKTTYCYCSVDFISEQWIHIVNSNYNHFRFLVILNSSVNFMIYCLVITTFLYEPLKWIHCNVWNICNLQGIPPKSLFTHLCSLAQSGSICAGRKTEWNWNTFFDINSYWPQDQKTTLCNMNDQKMCFFVKHPKSTVAVQVGSEFRGKLKEILHINSSIVEAPTWFDSLETSYLCSFHYFAAIPLLYWKLFLKPDSNFVDRKGPISISGVYLREVKLICIFLSMFVTTFSENFYLFSRIIWKLWKIKVLFHTCLDYPHWDYFGLTWTCGLLPFGLPWRLDYYRWTILD